MVHSPTICEKFALERASIPRAAQGRSGPGWSRGPDHPSLAQNDPRESYKPAELSGGEWGVGGMRRMVSIDLIQYGVVRNYFCARS
jgi:hypothetical protein